MSDIRTIAEQWPLLTVNGVGSGYPYSDRERFEKLRAMLLNPTARDEEMFNAAVAYLNTFTKRKTINRTSKGCSYVLKHEFEAEAGYITNGLFIVAALAAGFTVHLPIGGTPNVWFNIGKRRKLLGAR